MAMKYMTGKNFKEYIIDSDTEFDNIPTKDKTLGTMVLLIDENGSKLYVYNSSGEPVEIK